MKTTIRDIQFDTETDESLFEWPVEENAGTYHIRRTKQGQLYLTTLRRQYHDGKEWTALPARYEQCWTAVKDRVRTIEPIRPMEKDEVFAWLVDQTFPESLRAEAKARLVQGA